MSIKIEINEKQQFIVMYLHGQMTAVELVEEYEKLFREEKFKFNMNVLWDISDINLTRTPISEIRALPKLINRFTDKRGEHYKAALTTSRRGDYQLLKIYLRILQVIGQQVRLRIFPTTEEAIDWISE